MTRIRPMSLEQPMKLAGGESSMSVKTKVDIFYFEVSGACNFRCDFCPINYSKRKRQHMDFSLFTTGVDSIVENEITDMIGFHVLGEPLLYPRILDAISYANGKGLMTSLTTNGSLLTRDIVQALSQVGLNKLNISLQRFGESEHICRRAPLTFEQYYRKILNTVRQIHDSGSQTLLSIFLMDNSTKRFFHIDKPMQMSWDSAALRNGITILIHDLYKIIGHPVALNDVVTALNKRHLRSGTQLNISPGIRVTIKPFLDWGNTFTSKKIYPSKYGFCGLAFSTMAMLSNGELILCCADYEGETSLGNLGNQSLESILSSSQAISIEEGFQRYRAINPRCQRCLGSTDLVRTIIRVVTFTCFFKASNFTHGRPLREHRLF